jgi:ribosomal-protein-alanine N-acetyltransferase
MECKNVLDQQIRTSRLLLRKLSLKDANDMFEFTSNPDVTTHLHWNAHTDIKQDEDFIQNIMDKIYKTTSEFTYGIELIEINKLIGVVKLCNVCLNNKRGEFTSILNPVYQGAGYMAEAWQGLLKFCFENIELNRIQSYVTEDNIASQKKDIRAGMTYEGRLKQYWIMKGVVKDALVYGITREMYIQQRDLKK